MDAEFDEKNALFILENSYDEIIMVRWEPEGMDYYLRPTDKIYFFHQVYAIYHKDYITVYPDPNDLNKERFSIRFNDDILVSAMGQQNVLELRKEYQKQID